MNERLHFKFSLKYNTEKVFIILLNTNNILNCLIIKVYILKIFDRNKIQNFNDNISFFLLKCDTGKCNFLHHKTFFNRLIIYRYILKCFTKINFKIIMKDNILRFYSNIIQKSF